MPPLDAPHRVRPLKWLVTELLGEHLPEVRRPDHPTFDENLACRLGFFDEAPSLSSQLFDAAGDSLCHLPPDTAGAQHEAGTAGCGAPAERPR